MTSIGIAIVGCGNISDIYLQNLTQSQTVRVLACADLDVALATATAAKYGLPYAAMLDDVLRDPSVEIIVNLTTPDAHAAVAMAALSVGKHVYNEKPLALGLAEARQMLELAAAKNLRLGCAPDTFLGGGLQTCRQLIDDGAIGTPVAATAFMTCAGHESWHPNPSFYYQPGAGPLFDMGPYYLTALVNLLGPVQRVTGMARASFSERTVTSQPLGGQVIEVNTPTHISGLLEFVSGVQGTIITSFDVQAAHLPSLEIHGSLGSLSLPDPNTFGGPVQLFTTAQPAWQQLPIAHGYTDNSRGLGVLDMAVALRTGAAHRASGALALHVLEVMHGILESAEAGQHVTIQSRPSRPAALATELRFL